MEKMSQIVTLDFDLSITWISVILCVSKSRVDFENIWGVCKARNLLSAKVIRNNDNDWGKFTVA